MQDSEKPYVRKLLDRYEEDINNKNFTIVMNEVPKKLGEEIRLKHISYDTRNKVETYLVVQLHALDYVHYLDDVGLFIDGDCSIPAGIKMTKTEIYADSFTMNGDWHGDSATTLMLSSSSGSQKVGRITAKDPYQKYGLSSFSIEDLSEFDTIEIVVPKDPKYNHKLLIGDRIERSLLEGVADDDEAHEELSNMITIKEA